MSYTQRERPVPSSVNLLCDVIVLGVLALSGFLDLRELFDLTSLRQAAHIAQVSVSSENTRNE